MVRTCRAIRAFAASDSKTCRLITVWYGTPEPAMVKSTRYSGSPVCTKYGRPGHVHRGVRQRLVHRDESIAETANSLLVAQRLPQRGTQHDRGVLDGVVTFDLDVPARSHRQIEAGVAAQGGQHMVEERHPGVAPRPGRCHRDRVRRRCRTPWSCARPGHAGSWCWSVALVMVLLGCWGSAKGSSPSPPTARWQSGSRRSPCSDRW